MRYWVAGSFRRRHRLPVRWRFGSPSVPLLRRLTALPVEEGHSVVLPFFLHRLKVVVLTGAIIVSWQDPNDTWHGVYQAGAHYGTTRHAHQITWGTQSPRFAHGPNPLEVLRALIASTEADVMSSGEV